MTKSHNENSVIEGKNPLEMQAYSASFGCKTLAEEFLEEHYEFRRNVLRDIVEYKKVSEDNSLWRPLTKAALNSICLHSKHELGEDVDIKSDIKMVVDSEEPLHYDPINDWLDSLPEWDGKDRVVDFWKRIPGLSAEQIYFLSIWLRSVVAHWKGIDTEHGNECVPLLIGDQGIGKTTFCLRFLPPQLRMYLLDHFNLANKFDKEMALTNCLIIILDEFDSYTMKQQAHIKQALSKSQVNARKIFGSVIDVKHRYASFFATTNCRRPLQDPTGSRRYITIETPAGEHLDNQTPIDYEQLYAQVVYELTVKKERFWFNNDETEQILRLNAPYEQVASLEMMIETLYRKPKDDEKCVYVTTKEIRATMKKRFPTVDDKTLNSISIGKAMRELEFEKVRHSNGFVYPVVQEAGS